MLIYLFYDILQPISMHCWFYNLSKLNIVFCYNQQIITNLHQNSSHFSGGSLSTLLSMIAITWIIQEN